MALGRCLVDNSSILDVTRKDRRATPRLRVQFRTTFFASPTTEWAGIMLDLSLGGCRMLSPVVVPSESSLALRIYLPDLEWPLMVEAASVRWVGGETFGLAFVRMTDTERQRLEQVLIKLQKPTID
jgi:c-di-GMP-binding flagellar brake protein YcgR